MVGVVPSAYRPEGLDRGEPNGGRIQLKTRAWASQRVPQEIASSSPVTPCGVAEARRTGDRSFMLLQDRQKPVSRVRLVPIHNLVAIAVVCCIVAFLWWRLTR